MILRRITEHVKAQNWTALALDFVIVVVGVFMGLQVQQWNTERGDRVREQVFIERLASDFDDIKLRLKNNVDLYSQYIIDTEYVYEAVSAETPPKDITEYKRFSEALGSVINSRLPAGFSSTFVEMQASSNVDLLKNVDLKTALIEYHQSTRIADDAFSFLEARARDYGLPFFQSIRFHANLEAKDGSQSHFVSSYDFPKMTEDERFLSALNAQITVHANNRALQIHQLEKANYVLDLLQAEAKK